MEKTKVIFEIPAIEGKHPHIREISGDTVICFTVDKGVDLNDEEESIDTNSVYLGANIPDHLFGILMGKFVSETIENMRENKISAYLSLRIAAQILEEKSKSIHESMAEPEKALVTSDMIAQLLKDVIEAGGMAWK